MPNAWLNVPHCKQEFNYSCMAACVRMVLAHHGRALPEAELVALPGIAFLPSRRFGRCV